MQQDAAWLYEAPRVPAGFERIRVRKFFNIIALISLFVTPALSRACTVPVFRYALERWGVDRFEAIVFSSGKMSEREEAVVGELERAAGSRR